MLKQRFRTLHNSHNRLLLILLILLIYGRVMARPILGTTELYGITRLGFVGKAIQVMITGLLDELTVCGRRMVELETFGSSFPLQLLPI